MSCSSSEMDPDEMLVPLNVFDEPETFRPPPPPPTCRIYVREPSAVQGGEPAQLRLNLVGGHSLWAHHLWNAGLSMARYLDRHKSLVAGKTTLELGAAAGTPSLIAAINGAACTVITDYPDQPLLDNIEKNVDENAGEAKQAGRVHTVGYKWGDDVTPLLALLPKTSPSPGFDHIFMADLIFNHSEHKHMLQTCAASLAPGGRVFTTFTHHIVKWAWRNDRFWDVATRLGFVYVQIAEEQWEPMFPEDPGSEAVRGTVHCFVLMRKDEAPADFFDGAVPYVRNAPPEGMEVMSDSGNSSESDAA